MLSIPLAAAVCLLTWEFLRRRDFQSNFLCCAGDTDMKIFGSQSKVYTPADNGEKEAEEYVRHKTLGNIDLAKETGHLLGEQVITYRPCHPTIEQDPAAQLQCQILYLHAAHTCSEQCASSDIISTAVSQALLDTVSEKLASVYENYMGLGISTLYRLASTGESMGRLFAQLCDKKDDPQYIQIGTELYNQFMDNCQKICEKVPYKV